MEVFELDQELIEISGICCDTSGIWAVQDEGGWVYQLDEAGFRILSRSSFGWPGDYEAISCSGSGLLVVDSRGVGYKLQKEGSGWAVDNIWSFPDHKMEYEGVWQDPRTSLLYLIGRKPGKRVESRYDRSIWVFDPEKKEMTDKIPIPIADIWSRMIDFKTSDNPGIKADNNLPFSDLTQDPATSNWLILCCNPASIIVLTRQGELKEVMELDQQILPQAEGICIDPRGAIIVASEGLFGPPRAVRFKKLN